MEDQKLSSNFMLHEAERSATAARNGIDNSLPVELLLSAKILAERVCEPIRAEFGSFSPTSWYRSPELEFLICQQGFLHWARISEKDPNELKVWKEYLGRKSHPKAEAVDVKIPGITNPDLFDWCERNLEFDQLILEFYTPGKPHSGWVHISYSLSGNRGEVLKRTAGSYT